MEMLIGLLAVFSLFFVPITGVMAILITKFAFRPLVETLAKALRESGHGPHDPSHLQVQELTEQVQALVDQVRQLKDAHEFDRKLLNADSSVPAPFSS